MTKRPVWLSGIMLAFFTTMLVIMPTFGALWWLNLLALVIEAYILRSHFPDDDDDTPTGF